MNNPLSIAVLKVLEPMAALHEALKAAGPIDSVETLQRIGERFDAEDFAFAAQVYNALKEESDEPRT